MCARFSLVSSDEQLLRLFEVEDIESWQPSYNIAPTETAPAIILDAFTGLRKMRNMRFGLVPPWDEFRGSGARFVNARADSLFDKPAFRNAARKRRVIIPTTGFFEWGQDGGRKQPYLVGLSDGSPFGMAAVAERSKDGEGGYAYSFSIATTEPNELVEMFHDRMPVILHPDDYRLWLDRETDDDELLRPLLAPYPASEMFAHAVTPKMSAPGYKAADSVIPIVRDQPSLLD